jgi:hypothetical protein
VSLAGEMHHATSRHLLGDHRLAYAEIESSGIEELRQGIALHRLGQAEFGAIGDVQTELARKVAIAAA